MSDPIEKACAALATTGDVQLAASWARQAVAPPPIPESVAADLENTSSLEAWKARRGEGALPVIDELLRDPAIGVKSCRDLWKKGHPLDALLGLGRVDADAARAWAVELHPIHRPAAALLWSPSEAAQRVRESGTNRPPHIVAQDAYAAWAGIAWKPYPLPQLVELAQVGGDAIFHRHLARMLWSGSEVAAADIAQCLAASRHGHWCLDWIGVEGHRAPDRVRELLALNPNHAAVLRTAAGMWLDADDNESAARRAVRFRTAWTPAAPVSPEAAAAFIQQRWADEPDGSLRALPLIAGPDRVSLLADMVGLESLDVSAADEVVARAGDLFLGCVNGMALVPRLCEERWTRTMKVMTSSAAAWFLERFAATGELADPRAGELAEVAEKEWGSRARMLRLGGSHGSEMDWGAFDDFEAAERRRALHDILEGVLLAAEIEGVIAVLDRAVRRSLNLRSALRLLLPYPGLTEAQGRRVVDILLRADAGDLAEAEPFLQIVFEQDSYWHAGQYIDRELRRAYAQLRARCRAPRGP